MNSVTIYSLRYSDLTGWYRLPFNLALPNRQIFCEHCESNGSWKKDEEEEKNNFTEQVKEGISCITLCVKTQIKVLALTVSF